MSDPREVDVCFYCLGAGYHDGGDMRDDEPCFACNQTGLAQPEQPPQTPAATCDGQPRNANEKRETHHG